MRSIVSPAPFVVDQSVSGSFVGSLRLPPQAEEHPKPVILCWRVEVLIVTSEDCAAPPAQVPDPPSTPTVCTTPPSLCEIPPSGPTPLDPPPLPLDPAPELDEPPEVEPLLEPDDPLEPPDVPELEPLELVVLPELDALPEEEAAASLSGEPSLVELLPHAPAITTRQTRHPVIAERGRTPVLAVSMFTPSLSRSGSHRRNPSRKVGMLEQSSGDRQIRSGCRGRSLDPSSSRSSLGEEIVAVAHGARGTGLVDREAPAVALEGRGGSSNAPALPQVFRRTSARPHTSRESF